MPETPLCRCGRGSVITTWQTVVCQEEEELPDGSLRVVREYTDVVPLTRDVCRACHAEHLLRGLDAEAMLRSFAAGTALRSLRESGEA